MKFDLQQLQNRTSGIQTSGPNMGEVSFVTNIDSLPSFTKFQFVAPRALLEALLQLNEPDSMHVNVSSRNDDAFELSVNRTADDNILIQADGGISPVLEGVDERWSFYIKSVDGPIYLVTGGSETPQEQKPSEETFIETKSVLDHNVASEDSQHHIVYSAESDSEEVDSGMVGTVVSVPGGDMDSKAVEVEKAYPEIVRNLSINQENIQGIDYENDGELEVDVISSVFRHSKSQPLRTDVDLLLAAIEASNAAEQKTVNIPKLDSIQKRKRGRPRKLRLETPDGVKEEEILAVMEEIPLIIQNVLTYKCYECGKAFTSIDTLKNHMKMKHDERMDNNRVTNSVLEQAHVCFVCHRPTAGMKSLRKHLLGVHRLKYSKPKPKAKPRYIAKGLRRNPKDPNTPAVECELCGKKVISWDNLRNHTKKLHKDYPHLEDILKTIRDKRLKFHKRQSVVKVTCPVCSDQFSGLPVLSHIRSVHGSAFKKDELECLLLQVRKDIQKSYNILKKDRLFHMQPFKCLRCNQIVPRRYKKAHLKNCKAECFKASAIEIDVQTSSLALTTPEDHDTMHTEIGANTDGKNEIISISTQPQNLQLSGTSQTQSPTRMFSLLNRKLVDVSPSTNASPVELTSDRLINPGDLKTDLGSEIKETKTVLLYSPEGVSSAMAGDVSFMVVNADSSNEALESSQEEDTTDTIESGWAKVEGAYKFSQRDPSKDTWPKPCPTCGKNFNTSKAMAHHRRYVHFEELRRPLLWHECEICHKKMPNKNRLDKHMVVHTGYRQFQCNGCYRAFKDKYTLTSHIRTVHHKKYRHTCDDCGKGWDKITGLNTHQCAAKKTTYITDEMVNLISESTVDEDGTKVDYIIVQPSPAMEEGEINYLQGDSPTGDDKEEDSPTGDDKEEDSPTGEDKEEDSPTGEDKEEEEEVNNDYEHKSESPTVILSADKKLSSPCHVTLPRMEENLIKGSVPVYKGKQENCMPSQSSDILTGGNAKIGEDGARLISPEVISENISQTTTTPDLDTKESSHSNIKNTDIKSIECIKLESESSAPSAMRKSFRAKKQKVRLDL